MDLNGVKLSETALASVQANYSYLPADLQTSVALILTAIESVQAAFSYPAADTYASAKQALTAMEARTRRELSPAEIADHYAAYQRAIAPFQNQLVDILAHYQPPLIIERSEVVGIADVLGEKTPQTTNSPPPP